MSGAAVGPAMRLDQLLVERGLFSSREQARRAVMAGTVEVDGRRVDKPGTKTPAAAELKLLATAEPFASRAGRKLEGALAELLPRFPELAPAGRVCLDVGASTGGFTDVLLTHGAKRVYAVDVGYGQLDLKLRRDARVVVMERVNARYLKPNDLPEPTDLATLDLSFISLGKVVPAVAALLRPGGLVLALVKPQFEAGREAVGKGGIVRDEAVRRQVIEATVAELSGLGLTHLATLDSAVPGVGGNREAFALFARAGEQ